MQPSTSNNKDNHLNTHSNLINKYSYVPQRNKTSILSMGASSDYYDCNGSDMKDNLSNRSAGDFYDNYYSGRAGTLR